MQLWLERNGEKLINCAVILKLFTFQFRYR